MYAEQLWRELFRHQNLGRSVADIVPMLGRELGLAALVLQSIDLEHRTLTIVASGRVEKHSALPPSRHECSVDDMRALLAWLRTGDVRRGQASSDPLLGLLAGRSPNQDVIAVPLTDEEHGPIGVLLLLAQAGSFTRHHEAEAARLLEPFRVALATARRVQELARLREAVEADNRALLTRLGRQQIVDSIVGADTGFKQVMERVGQVAPTEAPVLLLGETGTGKEVVARAIHERSPRRDGPMLRVNCGAIAPGLVDSELFGHERGSFTGALAARAGWFERADGGTLFLDEIGELPPAAQVRLLRVLQECTLERVGGQRSVHVDVRVVAATHRDLEQMVQTGSFREDLWYRISVFPIAIPPLRDRREDIPALAAHFAWHAGKRIGGRPLAVAPAEADMLLGYDWPGNVRELAAVIERATILGEGKSLDIAGALGSRVERSPSNAAGLGPADATRFLTLDEAARRHIEAALERTRGKIEGRGGAAELLGVNAHTLRSRMRKLKLDWRQFRP
jgi:hydrogenase-4 transcriptional activator